MQILVTWHFCFAILHHWMINQLTIEIEFDLSKCPYSRICITLILAATMSQCSNKPYSRMSISPRIRGMRSIFVISGQIFLKWILALLRTVSGNYPRLDTGVNVFNVQLWPDPDAKPKSANNRHQRFVPNINLFIIYSLRVSSAFCNHICTFHAIPSCLQIRAQSLVPLFCRYWQEADQWAVTILTADVISTNVSSSVKVMYSRDVQIKEKVVTKTLFITNPIPDVEKIQSNCGIPKM